MEQKTVQLSEINPSMILNREGVRNLVKDSGKRGKETYYIPLSMFAIRKGFNAREDMGDIEELAKSILNNGQETPCKGDFVEDTGGVFFVPTSGHRRHQAFMWIQQQTGDDPLIEIVLNDRKMTDEDREWQQISENGQKPLTELEKAKLFARFKNRGYTLKQISEKAGCSISKVQTMLDLNALTMEEKNAIAEGVLKATTAISLARSQKSPAKRQEVIRQAQSEGKKIKGKDAAPQDKPNKRKELAMQILNSLTHGKGYNEVDFAISKLQELIELL